MNIILILLLTLTGCATKEIGKDFDSFEFVEYQITEYCQPAVCVTPNNCVAKMVCDKQAAKTGKVLRLESREDKKL